MKPVVSLILVVAGVLALLTTATVVRGRVRELKVHLDRCKQMCGPAQQDAPAAGDQSCCGTAV